jgi:hypothetical protein
MPSIGIRYVVRIFVYPNRPSGPKVGIHIGHATLEKSRANFRYRTKDHHTQKQYDQANAFNAVQIPEGPGCIESFIRQIFTPSTIIPDSSVGRTQYTFAGLSILSNSPCIFAWPGGEWKVVVGSWPRQTCSVCLFMHQSSSLSHVNKASLSGWCMESRYHFGEKSNNWASIGLKNECDGVSADMKLVWHDACFNNTCRGEWRQTDGRRRSKKRGELQRAGVCGPARLA